MISQSMEDYLKVIFEVLERGDRAATSAIAERMGIAPPSVTAMLKRLDDLGLVRYEPYRGATLTATGTERALEVVRHHRLIELYLHEALGVPWDQVHAEAEKLEHVISEDLERRMAAALDDPRVDPHGAPIPALDGSFTRVSAVALAEAAPGEDVRIIEVDDRDPELLRYLAERRLTPGTRLELIRVEPFDGAVVVRADGAELAIGRSAAAAVRVSSESDGETTSRGGGT